MYIYELPFEINKELCRLLDSDDDWKELAGIHMKYSAFDVNEIQQVAARQATSPTDQLFTKWGQLNHRVEELFILLYRMKHIPALRTLIPVVDNRFHRLLHKYDSRTVKDNHTPPTNEHINRQKTQKIEGSESFLPLPVMLIEKGVHMQTPSCGIEVNSTTYSSNTESTRNSSSQASKQDDIEDSLIKNVSAIPMLTYKDLMEATNNWNENNLLGRGGFGQVFKGEWKLLPVAVKRLRDNDGKNRELIREMCLNQYRHDNILPLYGYSLGGPEACLVYQLMAGGSLEQRLRFKTAHAPMSWNQRYRVAYGVARGLQYLHTMKEGTPLIHGDIKPANILLDQCTMPKIGDFGLARKGPYGEDRTHLKVSRVHGTRPYLPDEYLRSRFLSPAVDVFSYGVVMLEMATSLPAIDKTRPVLLLSDYMHQLANEGVDFGTLEDRILKATNNSNPQLCREFVSIGLLCTKYSRSDRPKMLEVFKRLVALEFPGKNLN